MGWIIAEFLALIALASVKKPKETKLSWEEVIKIFNRDLGNGFWQVYDEEKWAMPMAKLKSFLKKNLIDRGEYSKKHDCDSFAFELKGALSKPGYSHYAHAFAHSGVHAYNLVIPEEGLTTHLIEPQDDRVMSVRDIQETLVIFPKGLTAVWIGLTQIQRYKICSGIVARACNRVDRNEPLQKYFNALYDEACRENVPIVVHRIYATTNAYS